MCGVPLTHLEVPTIVQPGNQLQCNNGFDFGCTPSSPASAWGTPGVETMSQQSLQACQLVVIVVLLVVTTPEVEVSDKDYWQTWAEGLEYPGSMAAVVM